MHLGSDNGAADERLMPVRMLNEFTYCPRLFYLEFVQAEFEDNAFTVEGRLAHRRVDGREGAIPHPGDDADFIVRSVSLSSATLGLSAKIDLVEGEGGEVKPVDYKRGRPPENAESAHLPEQVQLCAYALLLREHGYHVRSGVLYFTEARTRVTVEFHEQLVAATKQLLEEARAVARAGTIPAPLKASPKCGGCSLNAVCLPDEVAQVEGAPVPARKFVPARDDAAPLYVQEQGAQVGINGDVLEVRSRERKTIASARMIDVSQVVLWGNVQLSAQAARELLSRGTPVAWLSYGGWLSGLSDGLGHGNIELRQAQFRRADDAGFSLEVARRLVRVKILNCRTLLRRNAADPKEGTLKDLLNLSDEAGRAGSAESLLGIEGNAARIYFSVFSRMLKQRDGAEIPFDFESRTRRPPRDATNALLSLAYSMLARELAVTVRLVGLDPFLGFYHRPRFGRPALALDLMEEFRPIVCDSVVISAINTGVVTTGDFVHSAVGVALKPNARKEFIRAFERRLCEEVTHPVFGYRVSYRRVLQVQVRLFARYLMGEISKYPEFRTR